MHFIAWQSAGTTFAGGLVGGYVARLVYEHYFRWRAERELMFARHVELEALRVKVRGQLDELEAQRVARRGL